MIPISLRTKSREYLGSYHVDLALGAVYVSAVWFVLLTRRPATAIAGALGLPLLFFVPGYAVLAAVFPRAARANGRIDIVERAVLSFGTSLCVLPLVALLLTLSSVGLTVASLVGALAVVSGGGMVASLFRRRRLPAGARFRLPIDAWSRRFGAATVGHPSPLVGGLNLLLAATVLLATATLAGAVLVPSSGASHTGLTVLTANETGSYVAGGYPTELSENESATLYAGVRNEEGQSTDYTVVVELQRVVQSDDRTAVLQSQTVAVLDRSVPDGETWYGEHAVSPNVTGEDLRLTYLLYRGQPPDDPGVDSAYRDAYVWIDVQATRPG